MEKMTMEKLKTWAEVQRNFHNEEISEKYLRVMLSLFNKGYVIGKDVEFFHKGERVENLLLDSTMRALIMEEMNKCGYYGMIADKLRKDWELNDPFIKLKNDDITLEVGLAKPFILDISQKDMEFELGRIIWFQAYATLGEALAQAKKIFKNPDFDGKLFVHDGFPTMSIHKLGKELVVNEYGVDVWQSMEQDLNVQLWQIALFESLPIEKQTLENYIKIERIEPITLKEFGRLMVD